MEQLREYLNSLFDGVTETPDILRAKAELLQMMEDKYDGLISDGLSDEAAQKTVIDEFGSFDEIARELGVEEIIRAKKASVTGDAATGSGAGGAGPSVGYGYTDPGTETPTGTATGGPNKQNFGPETEANRQTGKYDKAYKAKYRNFYVWNSEQLGAYFSFIRKHAFLVAGAVALCILAPFMASLFDDLFDHISANKLGDALSGMSFFICIGLAIAFFIMASRMTARYGRINKDAVAVDISAQEDLSRRIARLESARTAQLVFGIILCVFAPTSSALFELLPGVWGDIFGASVLLFAAIGVFFIIYSTSSGNRLKELSKGISRYEDHRGSIPESSFTSAQTAKWEYEPKFGMPVPIVIILVIVVAMMIKVGFNVARGVGIWGGSFWGFSTGKNYDGENRYPVTDVTGIDVDLSSGDVHIEQIDGTEILCSYHGHFSSRPEVSWNKSTKKITIQQETSFNLFNWGKNDGVVTVKVPRDTVLSYGLELSAGDLFLNGATATDLTVDQSAGDFSMNDSIVNGKTNLDLSAGDLTLKGSALNGKTELDMSAGDAVFENTSVKELKGDMSAGDFRFTFGNKEDAKKYNFTLETSAGDIYYLGAEYDDEVTIPATDTSDVHRIDMETSAGDIKIE